MYEIILNSKKVKIYNRSSIDYTAICQLALGKKWKPYLTYTITYDKGCLTDNIEGSLIRGQYISLCDGLIINCYLTDNA